MKTCRDCSVEKSLDCFFKQAASSDGYRNRCKLCEAARNRVWRAKRVAAFDINKVDLISLKTCSTCKEEKPGKDFYVNRAKTNGLQNFCKNCSHHVRRNWEMAGKHRLKPGDYDKMLEVQNKLCGICGSDNPGLSSTGKISRFHIDHDHYTGVIRGLLCGKCNKGLGLFNDDANTLKVAINWIQEGGSWIRET